MVINSLTNIAKLLQTLPLSLLTLSTMSSMNADQAISLAHQLIAKLYLEPYNSMIKPFAYISAPSSVNAFPIRWSTERSSWSTEAPWLKRQKDGLLDTVKEFTLRMSISASFHQSSIRDRSLWIVSNFGEESRLGLDLFHRSWLPTW